MRKQDITKAFQIASSHGNSPVVNELIKTGAQVELDDDIALNSSVEFGDLETEL